MTRFLVFQIQGTWPGWVAWECRIPRRVASPMETPAPQYKPTQRKELPCACVCCTEALSYVTMARVSAALHGPWPDRHPTPGQLPKSDILVLPSQGHTTVLAVTSKRPIKRFWREDFRLTKSSAWSFPELMPSLPESICDWFLPLTPGQGASLAELM